MQETRNRRPRTDPSERNEQILEAALAEAQTHGYQWITRDGIAERMGCAAGTVSQYGGMLEIKRAVVRLAVEREVLSIIAEAIASGSPAVAHASEDLRRRAMRSVVAA